MTTITVKEAASRAGVTRQNVEHWIRRCPSLVADGASRPKRVYVEAIDRIAEARKVIGRLSAAA